MKRFTYTILPICLILTACGGTPRPLPDISHARVWHVDADAARGVSGGRAVRQNAPQAYPQYAAQPVAPQTYPQYATPQIAPQAYSQYTAPQVAQPTYPNVYQSTRPVADHAKAYSRSTSADFLPLIMQAENQSSGYVRSILAKSREMTLYHKEIIEGGCWDYLDAAWTRAGVGRNMRQTVYKSEQGGAYAHVDDLRVGDWIYHINHSYRNIEHSGMFIGWVDKNRNLGLTLSYAGEGRKEPARYKVYDLSSVYNIMRAPS